MSNEAEELNQDENIDLEALANAEDQVEEIEESGEEDLNLTEIEQKAYDQGWRPKDQYTGKEGGWKDPIDYIVDGKYYDKMKETHAQMRQMKSEFNERLDNSNKLHEARRQKEISDLKQQQRDAVNMSDTDAFDSAQEKIDELEKSAVVDSKPVTNSRPDIDDWIAKNPWINEKNNEKADFANDIWNGFVTRNPNSSDAEALSHVEKQLSKHYPTDRTNPRRNQQNTTEAVTKRSKRSSKELTMSDLTQEEKSDWVQFGSMFKNEAAFLKAAKDARIK